MPSRRRAASLASCGVLAMWTPPPLPLPPAWICALMTQMPAAGRESMRASASSIDRQGPPVGTAIP